MSSASIGQFVAPLFFSSAAILYFQLLSIEATSLVLGSGFSYFVLGLAMLSLGAAGSLVSAMEGRLQRLATSERRNEFFLWLWMLLALSFMLAPATLAWIARLQQQMTNPYVLPPKLFICVVLSVSAPYFLFGLLMSLLFFMFPANTYKRIYFFDLCGAAAGCLASFFLIDHLHYRWSVLLSTAALASTALLFCPKNVPARRVALIALLVGAVLFLAGARPELFEPKLFPYENPASKHSTVTELESRWTSQGHLSAHEIKWPTYVNKLIIIGRYEGAAAVEAYPPAAAFNMDKVSAYLVFAAGIPERVLVLLAGCGFDMINIDQLSGKKTRITGVEINPHIIELGMKMEPSLRGFLSKPNISMIPSEARVFLEKDRGLYDVILISWSGATFAYYAGAINHSIKYIYTLEALEAMFRRLRPGGYIVFMNTNKLRLLHGIRQLAREHRFPADEAVVILSKNPGPRVWFENWDEDFMLVKPTGFDKAERDRIRASAKVMGLHVAYMPDEPIKKNFWAYALALRTANEEGFFKRLKKIYHSNFHVPRDDQPFVFQLFPPETYFSKKFIASIFSPLASGRSYQARYFLYVLIVAVVSLLSIAAPLVLHRLNLKAQQGPVTRLVVYFAAIGAGFMLIEVTLMQKMSLLLGAHNVTTPVVLGSLTFFAGLGSLSSGRLAASYRAYYLRLFLLIGCILGYVLFLDSGMKSLMQARMLFRCVFVMAVTAPAAFLMGQFFPLGLRTARHHSRSLVPWCWAINGVVGTTAAAAAPIISSLFGFSFIFLISALCYAVLLATPFKEKTGHRAKEAPAQ